MPIKKSRRFSRLNHRVVVFSLENFKGRKLPLNRAILQKYLFERENKPTKETRLIANHLVSEIVENFWLPARIPKKHNKKDYADQIVRLVKEYKKLKKIPESRRQERKVKQTLHLLQLNWTVCLIYHLQTLTHCWNTLVTTYGLLTGNF